MTKDEYDKLLELLEKHTLHNAMMIGSIQYNLIDLYGFKKAIKSLMNNDDKNL